MITRYKDKTQDGHDPGDENDYSYSDSLLVDTIEWVKNGPPPWKVDLMQKLAQQLFGKK